MHLPNSHIHVFPARTGFNKKVIFLPNLTALGRFFFPYTCWHTEVKKSCLFYYFPKPGEGRV